MMKTSRWAMVLLLALAGGGFVAYQHFSGKYQKNPDDRSFEDIPQDEYEQWMQSLGYTD